MEPAGRRSVDRDRSGDGRRVPEGSCSARRAGHCSPFMSRFPALHHVAAIPASANPPKPPCAHMFICSYCVAVEVSSRTERRVSRLFFFSFSCLRARAVLVCDRRFYCETRGLGRLHHVCFERPLIIEAYFSIIRMLMTSAGDRRESTPVPRGTGARHRLLRT